MLKLVPRSTPLRSLASRKIVSLVLFILLTWGGLASRHVDTPLKSLAGSRGLLSVDDLQVVAGEGRLLGDLGDQLGSNGQSGVMRMGRGVTLTGAGAGAGAGAGGWGAGGFKDEWRRRMEPRKGMEPRNDTEVRGFTLISSSPGSSIFFWKSRGNLR